MQFPGSQHQYPYPAETDQWYLFKKYLCFCLSHNCQTNPLNKLNYILNFAGNNSFSNKYILLSLHSLLSNHKIAFFKNILQSFCPLFQPIATLLIFMCLCPKDTPFSPNKFWTILVSYQINIFVEKIVVCFCLIPTVFRKYLIFHRYPHYQKWAKCTYSILSNIFSIYKTFSRIITVINQFDLIMGTYNDISKNNSYEPSTGPVILITQAFIWNYPTHPYLHGHHHIKSYYVIFSNAVIFKSY